ncbi:MAG: Zn-dependent protease [Myxococcota bacterium]|jgi:Zn-dependent protease
MRYTGIPMGDAQLSTLSDGAIWYLVFLLSTTLHEAAHAFTAYLGGDDTASAAGVMTADPTPHIMRSPVGMVLAPIVSFVYAGWMMGWASVPYDPHWGARHPRKQALMSAAGPAANLLLAILALIAIKACLSAGAFIAPESVDFSRVVAPADAAAGGMWGALAILLSVTLNLNVLLCAFNLLPVPPLDGSGVLAGLWPNNRLTAFYRDTQESAMIGLLAAWILFGAIAGPLFSAVLMVVHPDVGYSAR